MKSKVLSKWPLIISMAGITLALIIFLTYDLPGQGSYAEPIVVPVEIIKSIDPEPARSELPIRLKIPNINVDAAVEYVGVTPLGAMGAPSGPAGVAWFDLGPRPGENGNAVISGHYGWKNGIPAAFDDLHKLVKGDKIYIEGDKGTTVTFVVRESRLFGENANASDVFVSNDGKPHLNLITCEGIWNSSRKSYSNRLVVFADKE